MKNLIMTGMLLTPLALLFSGCGLGDSAEGSISATINTQYSTESSCLQLESGSGNQYCSVNVTVQNNQTGTPLSIFYTTDTNNVNAGLPAGYSITWSPSLSSCQSAMNSNIGTSQVCSASIQYTGGNVGALANVYFMLCTGGNCSTAGNPIVTTSTPIQINSID